VNTYSSSQSVKLQAINVRTC